MFLLNPKQYSRFHPDAQSKEMVEKTISFFEQKGLAALKKDDQNSTWHDDFFQFLGEEKILARLLTPAGYGEKDSRWDMWRIAEFNEILGFYGLSYWYAWQCTILGLGPIWMSDNEDAKHKAAAALRDGGLFSFGLSEKTHGADIYSTDMIVRKNEAGPWQATGSKYYIGNANKAAMVSTFGKWDKTGDYVFFVSRPGQPGYEVKKKVATSGVRPAFVAEFALQDYALQDKDILHSGEQAWNAALNTINIGKFELGFASVGIATHAFYEAIDHAANRVLYKRKVTDFPHVKKLFTVAYARLVAMKLYGLRACDYMRVASPEDRRYLLFNPIMKMKVTSQGEKVVGMLHDIIAAKGFEQDTYFEMAIRDIGMLPKLEGTTHVNMA
ncbi:MAG: acyl-CoA dehydrogenase, partial [Pseudobdellovibrionaceae bacterium]|nr:acyl-CoA dehydrogenase [Pseudobdellovibrionaceae bacterium]